MGVEKFPPRPNANAKAGGQSPQGGKPLAVPGRKPADPRGARPVPVQVGAAGAAGAASKAPAASGQADPEEDQPPVGFMDEMKQWLFASGNYYLASMLIHMALFLFLALVLGVRYVASLSKAPEFDAVTVDEPLAPDPEIKPFDLSVPADVDPSEIDLSVVIPQGDEKGLGKDAVTQDAKFFDNSEEFEDSGGGMKSLNPDAPVFGGAGQEFSSLRPGPAMKGPGGIGAGGAGEFAGVGGTGSGLGGRGRGHRDAMVARYGGTKATERAVAAALNWLARHQGTDGSWSLQTFGERCHGGKCSGAGSVESLAGATAMGVLPFLAAGQTHMANGGMYQSTVNRALTWLITHQDKVSGNLSAPSTNTGPPRTMYSHGLATIALCEAYGLTRDSRVGFAAQSAIKFIESSQNAQTGGWRYNPGEPGDTSVVGWQVMGLKSGQMAALKVTPATLDGATRYLNSTSGGEYHGQFAYQPGNQLTVTMTAVGLLSRQYLGTPPSDPGLADGLRTLMANTPDKSARNIYYWYYATQVVHNMLGVMPAEWDSWNRKMRRYLVDTQDRTGCAAGSWDPDKPAPDAWGPWGGRIMTTSLSCLTLEIYYRYLPLYDLEKKGPK